MNEVVSGELPDVLSAISVLLVFIFIAFNVWIVPLRNHLELGFEDHYNCGKTEEKVKKRLESKLSTYNNSILKITAYLMPVVIIAWLLTPNTIFIIKHCSFELWNFDPLNTLYLLINLSVWFLVAYLLFLIVKFINKRKDAVEFYGRPKA